MQVFFVLIFYFILILKLIFALHYVLLTEISVKLMNNVLAEFFVSFFTV